VTFISSPAVHRLPRIRPGPCNRGIDGRGNKSRPSTRLPPSPLRPRTSLAIAPLAPAQCALPWLRAQPRASSTLSDHLQQRQSLFHPVGRPAATAAAAAAACGDARPVHSSGPAPARQRRRPRRTIVLCAEPAFQARASPCLAVGAQSSLRGGRGRFGPVASPRPMKV
jgi:hypothetical protein